ncbi:MAG: bifunctional DNA-formamidopyrimidine glycosylase/DNA-(apurinic or apyrimidinic site) lyase [Gammaproteobacteria bacterium]
MPELPEVETTRCGIEPALLNERVARVTIRQRKLRQPIPKRLDAALPGSLITAVERRAKYILLGTDRGTALLHLGMSGSVRLLDRPGTAGKHDHVDIVMANGITLRFNDPRRFGLLLWTTRDPLAHPLLRHLGPEPLEGGFDGRHLHRLAKGRRLAIKNYIMDGRIVVGVGNIYASEALHLAGIHPGRSAGRIAYARMENLSDHIKSVLSSAIAQGGTTLRDFTDGDGRPGYFAQQLHVYDRAGAPCLNCDLGDAAVIRRVVIGQRSSYYCPKCQR